MGIHMSRNGKKLFFIGYLLSYPNLHNDLLPTLFLAKVSPIHTHIPYIYLNMKLRCTTSGGQIGGFMILFLYSFQDYCERIKNQDEKSLWPVHPECNHYSCAVCAFMCPFRCEASCTSIRRIRFRV
jgi:hypothetical protein